MICFRDMTFCCSKVHKKDCKRQITEEVIKAGERWWGSKDFPMAISPFCDNKKREEEKDAN